MPNTGTKPLTGNVSGSWDRLNATEKAINLALGFVGVALSYRSAPVQFLALEVSLCLPGLPSPASSPRCLHTGRVWGSKAAGGKALQRLLPAHQVHFLKDALARADLLRP